MNRTLQRAVTVTAIIGWVLLPIAIALWFWYTSTDAAPKASAAAVDSCPAGSYEIGRKEPDGPPICKLEPTGCPWGDSVPMDKCAPPADIECSDSTWTDCWPKTGTTADSSKGEVVAPPAEPAPAATCGK